MAKIDSVSELRAMRPTFKKVKGKSFKLGTCEPVEVSIYIALTPEENAVFGRLTLHRPTAAPNALGAKTCRKADNGMVSLVYEIHNNPFRSTDPIVIAERGLEKLLAFLRQG